jgi:hypothetical protein
MIVILHFNPVFVLRGLPAEAHAEKFEVSQYFPNFRDHHTLLALL